MIPTPENAHVYTELMNLLHAMLRIVGITMFGWILFITPFFYAMYTYTSSSENIKQTLATSGVYSNATPALLQATQENVTSEKGSEIVAVPEVQAIIAQAFPAHVLQNSSETVIDSFYDWLNGNTPMPQFLLDFSEQRDQILAGLTDYTVAKIEALPTCSITETIQLSQNINTVNPLTLTCRPAFGGNTQQLVEGYRDSLVSSESILQNPVIDSRDIFTATQFEEPALQAFPERFQAQKTFIIILLSLMVLIGFLYIRFAGNALRATKHIGATFLFAAAALWLSAYVYKNMAKNGVQPGEDTASAILEADIINAALDAIQTIVTTASQWAIAYLVIGIIALLVAHKMSGAKLQPSISNNKQRV